MGQEETMIAILNLVKAIGQTLSQSLRQTLSHRFSNPFVRNAGWLGAAELVNRVFRLGTTVTLARLFTPADYGALALIYTVHSFSEVLTAGSGIGTKIIQVEEEALQETCNTAYWLNWIICSSIFILQCLASLLIAFAYSNPKIILPICVAGLRYLIIPIFAVQASLIKRENRLKISALANVSQSMVGNILTIVLALLGFGIWAVVWELVASVSANIVVSYRNHKWRPPSSFQLNQWRRIFGFSVNVLGVRLLDKLRFNLDYLLVGWVWGNEVLGLYFFAFNAGIGISKNVINILISSLYPYLCEVRDQMHVVRHRYFSSLKRIVVVIVPMVLLQSLSAPFYVPIIFGPQWDKAIPILQIICLSAMPLSVTFAVNQLLNAMDKTRLNVIWNGIYTLLFAVVIGVSVQFGARQVAIAVLIAQWSTLAFNIWAMGHVLKGASSA